MKIVALLLFGMLLTIVVAALGTPFMWLGWNHGAVPALGFAKELTFFQSFWLSLAVAGVGNTFKSSLTINSKD